MLAIVLHRALVYGFGTGLKSLLKDTCLQSLFGSHERITIENTTTGPFQVRLDLGAGGHTIHETNQVGTMETEPSIMLRTLSSQHPNRMENDDVSKTKGICH